MPGRDKKGLASYTGSSSHVRYLELCRHLQRPAKYTCTLLRGLEWELRKENTTK